ncbi:RAM signaling pathway [Melampsora americana]|nr:RAM signaling pathway [Melampsora americana]
MGLLPNPPNLKDMSLSRTDQDFLDMTEATIDIAVSVSSMMLENLGQATSSIDSRGGVADCSNMGRGTGDGHPDSSSQRDRRHGEIGHVKQNKAMELKELCEIEIEIIKRLRLSLAQFWSSRPGPENRSPKERRESSEQTDDESIDSPGSKVNWLKGQESRRVYEDATAFVKAVIQTANLARTTMNEYPLSKAIREGLGELTKATKELATLLAVSSFKPIGTLCDVYRN